MSSDEMYERGAADAALGEPQPFYYQHYYHYRRGYDETRRRLRRQRLGGRVVLPVLLLAATAAIGVAALFWRASSPQASPTPVPTRHTLAAATRVPPTPTFVPTSLPTPTPAGLRAGAAALVTNTGGRPLRGRVAPGLGAPVQVAFDEGARVTVLEGPAEADGFVWWRVSGDAGEGWAAQASPEGAVWLTPVE